MSTANASSPLATAVNTVPVAGVPKHSCTAANQADSTPWRPTVRWSRGLSMSDTNTLVAMPLTAPAARHHARPRRIPKR